MAEREGYVVEFGVVGNWLGIWNFGWVDGVRWVHASLAWWNYNADSVVVSVLTSWIRYRVRDGFLVCEIRYLLIVQFLDYKWSVRVC